MTAAPPDLWWTDRTDPRVIAALAVKCPVSTCLVAPGLYCVGATGLVHQIRVPEKVLLRRVS